MNEQPADFTVTGTQLLRAALWYARHGWHVLPLRPRTKDPFKGIGVYQATTDTNQIEAWWSEWPNANIGIHPGASGLLAFDADAYKDSYDGQDFLTLAEQNTITNLTGGGGTHLVYRMPDGEKFGNTRGAIPAGIDIKGWGGYIVVPPSIHPTGRAYQWESGFGPHEIDPSPLPEKLLRILREARTAPSSPATFGDDDLPRPDIAKWNLSGRIVQLIYEGHSSADRSVTDQSVITALVNRGATDDEIRAVFQNFPIGAQGRYAEPDQGDRYLALSIGKARAYVKTGGAPPVSDDWHHNEPPPAWHDYSPYDTAPSEPSKSPPKDPEIFLTASADDEGNAQCVYTLHGGRYRYCNAYGWMENVGTHWQADGESEAHLNRAITEMLIARRLCAVTNGEAFEHIVKASKPSARNKRETKAQFADLVTVDVRMFDTDPHVINTASGVVDLRTGQRITDEASGYFSYCIPTEFVPNASATGWTTFLSNTVGDYAEIADWLQMAAGYSISGMTNEECMFYLHGPARSGKGTFTQSILAMLGRPLSSGVDFSTFTRKRDGNSQNFDLAPLRAARFLAASESGRYETLNEAVVKQITGNDPISAAFKHRDMFSFTPMFKVWLSSNHPARGDVDDDAFWGRIRVIAFPHSHLGSEDKGLKQRMNHPDILRGILAWFVEGARRWYSSGNKGLATPWTVRQATQSHREQLDTIGQWLSECTQFEPTAETTNAMLYASYQNWCQDNGSEPKRTVAFGRALASKGFEPIRFTRGVITSRGYRGLLVIQPS